MKILLTTLNAKYVHSNLALKYLYNMLPDYGIKADVFEFTINNEKNYVYGELLRGKYDLICFSCYIWNIEKIKQLASDLKKALPSIKICLKSRFVTHGERLRRSTEICSSCRTGCISHDNCGIETESDGRIAG